MARVMLNRVRMTASKLATRAAIPVLVGCLLAARPAHAQEHAQEQPSSDLAAAQALQRVLDDGAKQQRVSRNIGGAAALGIGAVFVGIGTGLTVDAVSKSATMGQETGAGITMLVGGGITLLAAPFIFLMPGNVEGLAERTRSLAAAGNLTEMQRMLDATAHKEKTWRIVWATSSFIAAAIITPIGAVSIVSNSTLNDTSRFDAGAAIGIVDTMLIGFGVAQLVRPGLAEELNRASMTGGTFRIMPSVSPTGANVTATLTF